MPGLLLHTGATVLCAHGGQAQPLAPNPRVRVSGQPVVTQPTPYTIAGCTGQPPPAGVGPCVSAQWVTGAVRVKVAGQPALLADSQAVCAPTGQPLTVITTQLRVKGI
jgi:hypothetical protein